MRKQGQDLKALLDRMESANDFQAVESYYTMEASAQHVGVHSVRTVELLINWQAECLLAYAAGLPMAPPPPGVQEVAAVAPGTAAPISPTMIERIFPFTEESFNTATDPEAAKELRAEFGRLLRDHEQLVGLGETYGTFDSRGKLVYLDELAKIVGRWEGILAAASRAGVAVDPLYVRCSKIYLERSRLTAVQYRDTVQGIHERMRAAAVKGALAGR